MSDAFVPLAVLLKPAIPIDEILPQSPPSAIAIEDDDAMDVLASDVRRFRARLSEAFDASVETLLRDFACAILGRELTTSPCEIAGIAADALERARDELPVGLRASSDDCSQLAALGFPIAVDAELRSGDVIVELRDGELDLRLGVRLEALLRDVGAA